MLMVGKPQYCHAINSCQLDLEVRCKPNHGTEKLFYGCCERILKFTCRGESPGVADTTMEGAARR